MRKLLNIPNWCGNLQSTLALNYEYVTYGVKSFNWTCPCCPSTPTQLSHLHPLWYLDVCICSCVYFNFKYEIAATWRVKTKMNVFLQNNEIISYRKKSLFYCKCFAANLILESSIWALTHSVGHARRLKTRTSPAVGTHLKIFKPL